MFLYMCVSAVRFLVNIMYVKVCGCVCVCVSVCLSVCLCAFQIACVCMCE